MAAELAIRGQREIAAPALIVAAGPDAERAFWEYFVAAIRNRNTRRAYLRAAVDFMDFATARGTGELSKIGAVHVAAWVEDLCKTHAPATVKQRLAGVRMLFDWLVVRQMVPTNPAASVRGPRHIVRRGKTPVIAREDARRLLEGIDVSTLVGLRDRALLGLLTYSFARIGAAVAMRVEDFFPIGRRWWVRLHEKGGKRHELPAHHNLEAWLLAYVEAADLAAAPTSPLFRSVVGRTGRLTDRALSGRNALHLVQRRARAAGLAGRVCCHTFRATGITAYLEHGGSLEVAQQIAAHESPRTTKLYDRREDAVTLNEIERIII
jgi:site-specific recombinase XerD